MNPEGVPMSERTQNPAWPRSVKIALVATVIAVFAIYGIISTTLDKYAKAILVLAIIGFLARVIECGIIDFFGIWGKIRSNPRKK